MKQLLIYGFVIGLRLLAFAAPETKCFQNGGLKDNDIIRFDVDGGKVTGVYTIEREYSSEATESYDFSGSQKGKLIKVNLKNARGLADARPVGATRIEMTIVPFDDDEVLRARFFNKKGKLVYEYECEPCEPSYSKLRKRAKRITKLDPSSPASESASFESLNDRRSFLLKLSKGQSLTIEAPGTSIDSYNPSKKQDAEGGIDILNLESVSEDGDYLVILKPAGEVEERKVTFTVRE